MTALILLAAGRGSRFGGAKLGAALAGKPLARHAADHLAGHVFTRRIAVCSATTPDLPGFERLLLDPVDAPLSRSVAISIAALNAEDAALIALADMPLVPSAHFKMLLERFDGDRLGSRVGDLTMVPAVFGLQHFAALMALDGDRGAGALLRGGPAVTLDPALALDVDTPDDLRVAEAALQGL